MSEVISLQAVREVRGRVKTFDPRADFDRSMELLMGAIDLIDDGGRSRAAARQAVCDACELLLLREERMLAWPRK